MANYFLTFDQYLELIDTTDESQETKFNKIYTDVEQTYLKDLLTVTIFDLCLDGTYNKVYNPTLYELIQKCIAKEIETIYTKTGTSQNTALGLIQRTNDFSKPAEIGGVKMKVEAILKVQRSYENQLMSELMLLPEYVEQFKPIKNDVKFRLSATDVNYYPHCVPYNRCKDENGHYPIN